jgi:two-component system, NtrC family, response regulator AtoC
MPRSKLNILVVDDSRTVRMVLSDELKALGYSVTEVASAEGAGKVLQDPKNNIEMVFLDLELPGMKGLEFMARVAQGETSPIFIVMTGYESAQSAVEAIEKGAYDYVVKPIAGGHLELIIKRALKRYQLEQARQAAVKKTLRSLEDFSRDSENTLCPNGTWHLLGWRAVNALTMIVQIMDGIYGYKHV